MGTDYEALAARYNEDRVHFHGAVDEALLAASKDETSSFRILDIGCGTGLWMQHQKPFFPHGEFFGVEPSSAMRALAQEANPESEIRVGSAEDIPYDEQFFSIVSSQFSFHHFIDKDKAISEITRVLKPAGTFLLRNLCPEKSPHWWLYDYFPAAQVADTNRFWTIEKIQKALASRGFKVESQYAAPKPLTLDAVRAEVERRITSQLADLADDAYHKGLDACLKDLDAGRVRGTGLAIVTLIARLQKPGVASIPDDATEPRG